MQTQIFKTVLILFLASSMFVACKKDDVALPDGPVTIEGKWEGKYGYDSDNPDYYYSFKIYANGTIEEWDSDDEVLGSGTWQLTGDVFTATYTWDPPFSASFKVTGTFDADKAELDGIWGYNPSDSDGGEWYMKKKNN